MILLVTLVKNICNIFAYIRKINLKEKNNEEKA